LASQYSFQWFRKQDEESDFQTLEEHLREVEDSVNDVFADELSNTDKTPEEIMGEPKQPFHPAPSAIWPFPAAWNNKVEEENLVEKAPYQPGYEDVAVKDDAGLVDEIDAVAHAQEYIQQEEKDITEEMGLEQWNKMI
jgi:hypothetical protein